MRCLLIEIVSRELVNGLSALSVSPASLGSTLRLLQVSVSGLRCLILLEAAATRAAG